MSGCDYLPDLEFLGGLFLGTRLIIDFQLKRLINNSPNVLSLREFLMFELLGKIILKIVNRTELRLSEGWLGTGLLKDGLKKRILALVELVVDLHFVILLYLH